jgi:hypothetical protein
MIDILIAYIYVLQSSDAISMVPKSDKRQMWFHVTGIK